MWGQDTPDYSGKYYIASDAIVSNKSTYDENTPANNYYLCPTDGWCYYKPENDYSDDGITYPYPFLTTYQWRDGVNDNKVIWIIEKHPTLNYYYFKQHIEGERYKYLMLNGKISGGATINRMRVHLEEHVEDTDHPTENALFSITLASSANASSLANAKSVIITPKNTESEEGKRKYLVVNGGNANFLTGQSGKDGGPGSTNEEYKWTKGIIGLYYDDSNKQDANAPFYLENKPTISFSDQNKVRITYFDYANNEVEIRYTINGDTPTASSTLYEGEFDPPAGTTMIKAIAIKDDKESDVTTFSPPVFLGSTHQYIIQSKNCKFYNMIPNVSVDDDTKYVSALNVPCSTMAWHFEYAEEGYYYIVDANGWYMYYTTTDNTSKYIYLKSSKDDSDGYKFQIASHANGGYNIIPKGQTKAIYKNNFGNNDAGLKPVMFDGTITNDVARWDLIPYSTTNLPMWEDQPFTVSTDEETYYYNIVSVSQPTKPLILNNSGLIKSEIVPTSDYDERKAMWVIKKVGQDTGGLLDYYTLQNAYTGDLLYYNGSGREIAKNASPGVLQNGMPTTEGADATWAHFVIVQTVSGYNIIPRVLVDNTKAITRNSTHEAFNCINRAIGNDWTGTYYDIDDGSRWTFTKVDNVKCIEPVFTEEANGDITITTVTNAAKILYTINDVNNPDASSTEYTTKENTSVKKVIKAIAIMGDDANTASSVVTLLNMPEITLDQSTYTYDGTAKTPTPSKVYIGTTETTSGFGLATTTPYLNNINAGTATVKVEDNDPTDSWYIWNATTDFTINKATAIVKADDKTKGFGDADPAFTATVTGIFGNDIVNYNHPITRTEGENVGDYTITPSGDDEQGNYNVTYETGTLTITPKVIGNGTTPAEGIDIDITYDGSTYQVTVTQGNNTLEEGDAKDYTWEGTGTDTDTYVVTITGHGNYNNSAQATYIKHDFYDTTPDDPSERETAAVYYATQNLQVSNEFDAYYVTKLENNELTIAKVEVDENENKISYIPANQPVLLLSKEGGTSKPLGFTLKPYTGTQMTFPAEGEEGANLLKVVTEEGGKSVALTEVYIFSAGEFVLSMAGTMSKGKFYLENPAFNTSSPVRKVVRIRRRAATSIDNDEITGIDSQSMDSWYTIDGRRLSSKPTKKGLYIKRSEKGKSGSVTVIK